MVRDGRKGALRKMEKMDDLALAPIRAPFRISTPKWYISLEQGQKKIDILFNQCETAPSIQIRVQLQGLAQILNHAFTVRFQGKVSDYKLYQKKIADNPGFNDILSLASITVNPASSTMLKSQLSRK